MPARSPICSHETLAALAAIALLSACADIGQRPPANQDRVLRTERVEVVVPGAHAAVTQTGTSVELQVAHVCDVRPARVVDRRTKTESYNKSPGTDWLLLGTGILAVGAGTLLVVDAEGTYPDDRSSRTYNETGPGKERLYGYTSIGTGTFLGVVAFVDALRANRSTVSRRQVTLTGEPERRGVRCTNRPFANVRVDATVVDEARDLGKTDAQGYLEVDLDQVIPDSAITRRATTLELRVGDHAAGNVDLRPYYLRRETEAFRNADGAACAASTTTDSCNGIKLFLEMYPNGPHASEAREVLAVATPKLTEMEDELAWSKIRVADCTRKAFEKPSEVVAACLPLRRYLEDFSSGRHGKEAAQALSVGEGRARGLADEIDRRAKAERAREAAAERRKCVAQCRVICSSWRFSDQASCFSGCVDAQCSESSE